jgi:hypothetical protein
VGVDDDVTGEGAGLGGPEQGRSGDTVQEAVERFETGTAAEGDHTPIGRADPGGSRLERMVEVEQTGTGDPDAVGDEPEGPGPRDVGSGGAQRLEGARTTDRLAGGGSTPSPSADDAE